MTGRISYHYEVKRMSYLIRDIEFTDIAGDGIKGMYHDDLISYIVPLDHMIGKDKSRDWVKTGFPITIKSTVRQAR